MRPKRILFVVVLIAGCVAGSSREPLAESSSEGVDRELSRAVHWMRNSAEYQAAIRQTYSLAARRLREMVADRPADTWAVAVDADETVINNSEYEKELTLRGAESTPELWDAWVARRAAPPLPGAIDFLELVQELGGRVVIVTNRLEEHCPDTQANFRAFDIPFDAMLCRTGDREKEPRWEMVERGRASADLPPLEIVMWIGDNIGDFPGLDQEVRFAGAESFAEFGDRFFVMPNPLYRSWAGNPQD